MGLVAVLLQYLRERGLSVRRDAEGTEADRLRVAMKDALQPVAELIAEMPDQTKRQRQDQLRNVAIQAVGALILLLKDVERLRAVVYRIDDAGMSCLAYQGRGNTPNPFLTGTDRGDLALLMVEEGRDHFQADISTADHEAYRGSGNGYQTYISASIRTGDDGYGMVTVDAPHAGDLVDTDQQIVMVMADLLAIAFAEAERN